MSESIVKKKVWTIIIPNYLDIHRRGSGILLHFPLLSSRFLSFSSWFSIFSLTKRLFLYNLISEPSTMLRTNTLDSELNLFISCLRLLLYATAVLLLSLFDGTWFSVEIAWRVRGWVSNNCNLRWKCNSFFYCCWSI